MAPASTAPSTAPSSAAPLEVTGTTTRSVVFLTRSRAEYLGIGGDTQPDDTVVAGIVREVARQLDRHLTGLNEGEPQLGAIGAAWARSRPLVVASLTDALATADNPVTEARYDVTVQWDGDPVSAIAVVDLERRDGTSVGIELVFDVSGDRPELAVLGAGATPDGSAAP